MSVCLQILHRKFFNRRVTNATISERKQRDPGKKSFKVTASREERLYCTDDGVAMSLSHDADLAAVRARSRTDVTLDHGAVPFLYHH